MFWLLRPLRRSTNNEVSRVWKVASKAATEPRLQMFQIPKIRGYKVLKKKWMSNFDNFERERRLKVEKHRSWTGTIQLNLVDSIPCCLIPGTMLYRLLTVVAVPVLATNFIYSSSFNM